MRIVYFDLDCVRPDHLGCYGYRRPTSPNIDRLARDAVLFDTYYCASSPCLPSRTALWSGRYGIRNGVISNVGAGARFRIRTTDYGGPVRDNDLLMRQFRRHGYDTISFSNFADRHSAWYWMCGWSEFHTPNLKGGGETGEEVNEPLLGWLAHNATRENYFLHINYWDAHRVYKMDASWADPLRAHPVPQAWPDAETLARLDAYEGPFTSRGQHRGKDRSPWPLMPDDVSTRERFEHMVTGYDAAIRYVDHHIGIVLEELERQGILSDAVVIVSADHGDAFGEHGIYSDHVCADECIHRVPLVVRWPGLGPGGRHVKSLLTNVDLGPTLCELLGFEIPADWDGVSFAPHVRGEPGGIDRDYLVWDHALYTVQRAVRTREHLMVRTYDSWRYAQYEPVQLYEMTRDPYQTTNLAGTRPEVLARCDHHLAEWTQAQMTKPHFAGDPIEAILAERAPTRS